MKSLLIIALFCAPYAYSEGDKLTGNAPKENKWYERSGHSWEHEYKLVEVIDDHLSEAKLELALTLILESCVKKYNEAVTNDDIPEDAKPQLLAEIKEAIKALEFAQKHSAKLKKADEGTNTYCLYTGYLDALFGRIVLRDGSGEKYESCIVSISTGKRIAKKLMAEDAAK